MTKSYKNNELIYYSTKALAKMLDVTPDWLNHNRKSHHPIPFKKVGRLVRYEKNDILEWIGRKDLELQFFNSHTLAKQLDVTVQWLKNNRNSDNPIPYRHFGRLVRYQKQEVAAWIRKQKNRK